MATQLATIETERGTVVVTALSLGQGKGHGVELEAGANGEIRLNAEEAAHLVYQVASWGPCQEVFRRWLDEPGENVLAELLTKMWALRESKKGSECIHAVETCGGERLYVYAGREQNGAAVLDFHCGPTTFTLGPQRAADLSCALEQWRPCYEELVRSWRVKDEEGEGGEAVPLTETLDELLTAVRRIGRELRASNELRAQEVLCHSMPDGRAALIQGAYEHLHATRENIREQRLAARGEERLRREVLDQAGKDAEQWERYDSHEFRLKLARRQPGGPDPEPQTYPVDIPEGEPSAPARALYAFSIHRAPGHEEEGPGEVAFAGVVRGTSEASAALEAAKAKLGAVGEVKEEEKAGPFHVFSLSGYEYTVRTWKVHVKRREVEEEGKGGDSDA